ncbi:MAG: response regulator [Clostridia bacterium]
MRVFLVEDEMPSLRSLEKKTIDTGLAVEVVGTACSAEEALQSIDACKPELVITDIRMEGMDGIALIEKLKARYPSMIYMITSGYHEFEYAKRAMKLGVEDYLLKPIDPEELKQNLQKCMKRLVQQSSVLPDHVFSILLGDTDNSPSFYQNSEKFAIVYFIAHNFLSNVENVLHPSVPLQTPAEFEHLLSHQIKGALFCLNGMISNEKIVLLPITDETEHLLSSELVAALSELSQNSNWHVTAYLSRTLTHECNIHEEINQARNRACKSVILGRDRLVTEAEYKHWQKSTDITNESIGLFSVLLTQRQTAVLQSHIHALFLKWQNESKPLYYIQKDLAFLLDSLKRAMPGSSIYEFDAMAYLENTVCDLQCNEELCNAFLEMLPDLFGCSAQSRKELSADGLILSAEDYLTQHLNEVVTLQMLCDYLNCSHVYLCRVFKSIKQATPMDYFTKMKIEKAKEMMAEHKEMAFKDISQLLGFNDPYYFSKVFKRIEGVSPTEYRNGVYDGEA